MKDADHHKKGNKVYIHIATHDIKPIYIPRLTRFICYIFYNAQVQKELFFLHQRPIVFLDLLRVLNTEGLSNSGDTSTSTNNNTSTSTTVHERIISIGEIL